MKSLLLPFCCMVLLNICTAQNLVPNPSFEDTLQCPNDFDNVDGYVKDWTSFGNSPDFFDECSSSNAFANSGVPQNLAGHQHAKSGQAFAGLATWLWNFQYREFIGVQLNGVLNVGTKYFLSFWVSLADSAWANCPSNNLGAKFTTVEFSKWQPVPLDNHAQVSEGGIISDKENWTMVSGSFIADSAYRYMAIGNFFNDANTDTSLCVGYVPSSYYYVDAICLTTDSVACFSNEGVSNTPPVAVQFTQSSSAIQVSFASGQFERYIVYNALGQVVEMQQLPLSAATASFNTGNLPAAVYVFHLFGNSKNFTRKFLVH